MNNRNKAILKLILTMALVSLVITYAKQSLNEVPFFTFVWLQMVFASVAMLINTFVLQKEKWPIKVTAKAYLMVFGIGVLNYIIVRLLFIYSLDLLPVTTHAYLLNFVGIVTMVFSAILLKEKPKRLQILGASIAILGLWIFFYESPKEGELQGLLAILIAIISLALTNILLRNLHLIKEHGLSHNHIATFAVCIGSFPLIVWGLLNDLPLLEISAVNWSIIVLNGIVANALVMTVFSQVMQHLKAYEASILAMSALIFTAIFAMPILNDYLAGAEILGIVLLLVGIGIVQWRRKRLE
jgi:O-acetylserine/cysteine efflux transporter